MKKEGMKVNKVKKVIYRRLVLEPFVFFLFKKYRLDAFLKIINKNIKSKNKSIINKN